MTPQPHWPSLTTRQKAAYLSPETCALEALRAERTTLARQLEPLLELAAHVYGTTGLNAREAEAMRILKEALYNR